MSAGNQAIPLAEQEITTSTDTRTQLEHARMQAMERNLDSFNIVDVDAHHNEIPSWSGIVDYIPDPVLRHNAKWVTEERGVQGFSNYAPGLNPFQDVFGRIPHQTKLAEEVDDDTVHRNITLARRAMDSMSVDVQVIFPNAFLQLGLHPNPEIEAQLAFAYNRWFIDHILSIEPTIKGFLYLPFNHPEATLDIIRKLADSPGIVGCMVTSQRFRAVHHNDYMPIYAELQERGLPLAFHASLNWAEDEWIRTTNSFLALHAISFVHCNIVHLTNWVTGGIPERFPNLRPIWMESGLSWIPYLMQRLDHSYLMRPSDAPLLKRVPSEYMREMFYTSQPMERGHPELLESTFKAIGAETQLLYSSDWPHWDWDPPSVIYDIPFLSDKARRNILGENARRIMPLD